MSGKLEQRIQSAHLTRTEKVIADYFLEHSGSLYFLTAKDIALALGVSDTSVIRLCRTLGYRGFRELQESLRSELSQVIEREKYVIPQHQVPDKLQKYQDLSSFQCLQFAVDCLQETYRKNDPEKYGQIVRILLESEHIFVSGFRGLAGPARHLGTLLSQYTRHVEYFCDADTRCVEKLLDYGPHDCVILLGAERYSRMTCVLAEMAHADRHHRQAHRALRRRCGHRASRRSVQPRAHKLLYRRELSHRGHRLRVQPHARRISAAAAVPAGRLPVRAAAVLTGGQKALQSQPVFVTI